MHKTLILGLALAVAAIAPAAAVAKPAKKDVRAAKKECTLELKAYGKANFKAKHKSLGRCVKTTSREERRERIQSRSNAAQDCKAERRDWDSTQHDNKSFEQFYGTEESNYKNAFGKCVSSKAKENKAELDAQDADERSAARFCRGLSESELAAYGTEQSNRKNAFGKCVSTKARERGQARRQEAQAKAEAKKQEGTSNRPAGTGKPA